MRDTASVRVAKNKSAALMWLCAAVFVLTAMPRLNVKIGPLPFYAIDFLVFMAFVHSLKIRSLYQGKRPFESLIQIILMFAILGEFGAVIYSGSLLEPVYILIRTLLAFSLFYSVSRIVQTRADLLAIIKAATLGIIVTAMLMVMSSLPFTRPMVMSMIFSNPFLEPAAEGMTRSILAMSYFADVGVRGRSLVGVSILSGAFINTMWPLIALLYRWPGQVGSWKMLALAGSLLAPLGVVLSYSRGAVLGLFLVVGGVLFFGSSRTRQGVIVAVLVSVTLFSFFGWDSKLFFFERLEERTIAMIENPYEDVRETDRIFAYSEPFDHLIEQPQFLIMGEGVSIGKTGGRSQQAGKATHAAFAKAYYSYGMIAAFLYVLLVIKGFSYVRWQIKMRKKSEGIASLYSQALFASLLGMLPWFVFGHAAISQPRGAMLFFFLFGLIASLKNFPVAPVKPKRSG